MLIAALFIVGEGLVRTGIAVQIGDFLLHHAAGSEGRLIALLMLAVSGLGAIMSSTGVVAIFIPVVLLVAERQKLAPGRLMMPLSFAGLISGMLTLVGTPSNPWPTAPCNTRALPASILQHHADWRGRSRRRHRLHARCPPLGETWRGDEQVRPQRPRLRDFVREYHLMGARASRARGGRLPGHRADLEQLATQPHGGADVVAVER